MGGGGDVTLQICSCWSWVTAFVLKDTMTAGADGGGGRGRGRGGGGWSLTSLQHASVSQGRICSDICTCCHTEIEVADQTFHYTQSQYTDTGTTSPSADPISNARRLAGRRLEYQYLSHWYDSTRKNPAAQARMEPQIFRSRGGRLNH